jgi:hypothetical protein
LQQDEEEEDGGGGVGGAGLFVAYLEYTNQFNWLLAAAAAAVTHI